MSQPKAPRPPAEVVKWVDSCSPRTWTPRSDLKGYLPSSIVSVGFVVDEGETHLTIAGHWSPECVDGILCIPKAAITSRRVLRRV